MRTDAPDGFVKGDIQTVGKIDGLPFHEHCGGIDPLLRTCERRAIQGDETISNPRLGFTPGAKAEAGEQLVEAKESGHGQDAMARKFRVSSVRALFYLGHASLPAEQ
jgi:hypothetical protein